MSLKRYPRHFRLRGFSMSIKKQQGVAGIIFMGMLPILVIIMVFSMQMTQRHMAHAKITEAAEVASLALIASPKEGDEKNQEYAQKIVDHYIEDNKGEVVARVFNRRCEYKDGCVQRSGELAPFTDFVVSAKTKHDSWISYNDGEMGLTKDFEVMGTSTSRKFLPQPLDIYFIIDMSGSMVDPWGRSGKRKYDVVAETINRIVNDLREFKTDRKSRVAVIGFHHTAVKQVGRQRTAFDYSSYRTPLATVNNMFTAPKVHSRNDSSNIKTFEDIPLTEDYDAFLTKFNSSNYYASRYGLTESWQGIIGAAQMAEQATDLNPEQVFILLSDGRDGDFVRYYLEGRQWREVRYNKYLNRLVKAGLCEKLKTKISQKRNVFQSENPSDKASKTKVTMGVIGVNYVVDKNDGIGDCFGHDNIYHAKEGNDVYKYILNLINEETGRLKD
ncbi:VWA domain-containing protein [Vibrio vulnificus]|uniref:TadE/TadG family type IV pilus assembly protein n=1 Tax=Vibrio vulnificus TaxID=672 RepID=UPI001A31A971|nr:VWA domain-containing protein [Vibrio vulnificus]EGR7974112.1 VWA domain-containing protein [Vibrio vulnificus]MCA3904610.1 VWA domain-containing protein [Vibrio vulnificus]MCU8108137.1 VWA domain-containing protein [Vibrio vulnificus]HAS8471700.1 VWA domain-containing protein [Vibrio vulnificus]HAS8502599.1 VWA domain-containing protein [Vibrio vulnificus]